MYGAGLFAAALNLTFAEDAHYNLTRKTTYSQRDVPGLTRGAIPLLAAAVRSRKRAVKFFGWVFSDFVWLTTRTPHGAYVRRARRNRIGRHGGEIERLALQGVTGVSVGMNPSVPPLNVPDIFRWRDNASDTEVVALFHKRGYGGCFNCGGGSGHPTLRASDCATNADARAAICYAWRSDNSGPHTYAEAVSIFESAQRMFPAANISAINALDEFVAAVEPHKANLPLVTAELGDTWIEGASSDPLKVALFRSASRQRARCIATRSCDPAADSPAFKDFERLLMKAGEHTWGWNGGDTREGGWSNADFAADRRSDPQYRTAAQTWQEQRAFVPNAVAALGDGTLKRAILADWSQLRPARFSEAGFETVPASLASRPFSCGSVTIAFDQATSGIRLLTGPSGARWATNSSQLAKPWYQNVNFTQALDRKPGLNLTALNSTARLVRLQVKAGEAGGAETLTSFKLTMTMPDNEVHEVRGAPALLEALVEVPHALGVSGAVGIRYTLQWFNKTATKAPETIWLLNKPPVRDAAAWRLDKLGSLVNPLDADVSLGAAGTRCTPSTDGRAGATCGVHLHAIDSGAFYNGSEGRLGLASLDSSLVSVGDPLPSPGPYVTPDPLGGVHFSLVDNTWNTNYPEWYPFIEQSTC